MARIPEESICGERGGGATQAGTLSWTRFEVRADCLVADPWIRIRRVSGALCIALIAALSMAEDVTVSQRDRVRVEEFLQACTGHSCMSESSVITARAGDDASISSLQFVTYKIDSLYEVSVERGTHSFRWFCDLKALGASVRQQEPEIGSPSEAFDRCVGILGVLGLPTAASEYEIDRESTTIITGDGTALVEYVVSKECEYEDIREIDRGIWLHVLEGTGRVSIVRYDPCVIPENTAEPSVSFEDAVNGAPAILSANTWTKDCQPQVNSGLSPAKAVVVKAQASQGGGSIEKAYVCWEVPFTITERGGSFDCHIWFRCDTGAFVDLEIDGDIVGDD